MCTVLGGNAVKIIVGAGGPSSISSTEKRPAFSNSLFQPHSNTGYASAMTCGRVLSVGSLWPSSMVNRFLHLFFGRSGKAKPHGFLKIGPVIGDKIEGAFTPLQQVVTGIRGIPVLQQHGIAAFPGNIIGEAQGIGANIHHMSPSVARHPHALYFDIPNAEKLSIPQQHFFIIDSPGLSSAAPKWSVSLWVMRMSQILLGALPSQPIFSHRCTRHQS